MNELDLFAAVIAIADPGERASLLDRECAGRPDVRKRIHLLLEAHFRSHPLLDQPVPEVTGAYAPNEQPGAVIASRYKLLEAIGEGGMGTVWVAEQTEPVKRKVALKLIKAGMDSKSVLARFEAERQALAVMDHPNIAKVLDGGLTETGRPFFVMDYVKGVPITEYCDATRLSVAQRLELFVQVCQAVQHAHQKGIIHRDLKPSNILVAPYDDKPVPKIIDFGLAKAMHQSLTDRTLHTAHESVLGTPLYMSPEQAQLNNLDVDTRSDIYSLGVLLYELLTGTTPLEKKRFKEAAWEEIRRIIREEEPPRPSTRLSSTATLASLAAGRQTEPARLSKLVRGDLDWITMKALEKDRTRRYETANGLARDIQRYLSDEPVEASPPSATYRLRKLARKHRTALTTAAAFVVLLVAGAAVATWQAVRATQAETLAVDANTHLDAANTELKTSNQNLDTANQNLKTTNEKLDLARIAADQAAAAEKLAADKEREATALALTRLKEIEKANGLLESIFTDVNPRLEQKGGPLLIEQLTKRLLAVGDKLDTEAIRDPLTVARLQNFLGTTLHNLGEYGKAIELHQQARRTREKLLGPDHPDTLQSMNNLAGGYHAAGKLDLALPLYEETLQLQKARLGADHPGTLLTMNNLATGYRDAGKWDLALPLDEETLKLRKAKLGPDHPDTLSSMNNLAMGFKDAGKLDLALPLFEETFKLTKVKLGPDHPGTLISMNNLAMGYYAAGKLDLAVPLLEETLKLSKAKLGPEHPDTLISMSNLADGYKATGKLDLALPLHEETLKLRKAKLGLDHPDTLISMNNLALVYQGTGKLDLALRLFEQTLKLRKAKLGSDHPGTLASMGGLAEAYRVAHKLDLALPLFEETLKLQKAKLGPDHPNTLATMNNLALGYQAAGKVDLALPLFEETVKLMKAKLGPDHPSTLVSMNNLARGYQAAGKLDLALPLFEETLNLMKAKLGPDHPGTLTFMNNLASGYQAAGNLDLALPLFEETLKLQKAKLGPDHPGTLATMNNLALGYQAAGKVDLALPLFEESLKLMKVKLGSDHPDTLTTMKNLAGGYNAAGKLDLALTLCEETLKLTKAKLGPDHRDTLRSMNNLAEGYWRVKRIDQSIPLFEETLKLQERNLGRAHPDTQLTVANLGVNYRDAGRLTEALPLLEEAYRASQINSHLRWVGPQLLAGYTKADKPKEAFALGKELLAEARKTLPKDSTKLAESLAQCGFALLQLKAYTDAEPLLRECLAIREKKEPDAWTTYNARSLLGGALLGQKKYQGAEPLLKAAYEAMKTREKTIPPQGKVRLTEAAQRLVELYSAINKPGEAKRWQAEWAKYPDTKPADKK
jgi:serine/threonine protein kinase